MPIGIIVNSLAVLLGGIAGAAAGHLMSDDFKRKMNMTFGLCSLGMGISSIPLMVNMPAVVFAIVAGTAAGAAVNLGRWINAGAALLQKPFAGMSGKLSREEFLADFVPILILFCVSSTGIYGSIDSAISGDHSVLLAKSILDLFTAAVFACTLGYAVAMVAIPQLIIFLLLFFGARLIYPLTTPDMIADFKACGGFLLIATGMRILKLRDFPIADMLPAMLIVMPCSWLWSEYVMPLL